MSTEWHLAFLKGKPYGLTYVSSEPVSSHEHVAMCTYLKMATVIHHVLTLSPVVLWSLRWPSIK